MARLTWAAGPDRPGPVSPGGGMAILLISPTKKIPSGISAISPHLDAAATAALRVGRAPELADRLDAAS